MSPKPVRIAYIATHNHGFQQCSFSSVVSHQEAYDQLQALVKLVRGGRKLRGISICGM